MLFPPFLSKSIIYRLMKYFFLTFALFNLGQAALHAQSIEFSPPGSVWEYQRQAPGWGPPVIDFVQVRYVDDVWIDSILCKRLVAPEGDYYIYQVGDRVYHRFDTSQFKLLWDFGVMPGDSFLVYSNSEYLPNGHKIKFTCTGRDTVMQNSVPLPRIFFKNVLWWPI